MDTTHEKALYTEADPPIPAAIGLPGALQDDQGACRETPVH
jgi:hypothetical protein